MSRVARDMVTVSATWSAERDFNVAAGRSGTNELVEFRAVDGQAGPGAPSSVT